MIETEKEFNNFVSKFGGKKISDIVGISPGFLNADYIFDEYKVIAELKCLEDDKIKDPKIIEHATKLYNDCAAAGYPVSFIPGTSLISTEGMPDEFKAKFADLYRIRLQRVVKKADDQIRVTKEKLQCPDYTGLLILVNDNNTAVHPGAMPYLLQKIFSENAFPSIEQVLFFTFNLAAEHPEINNSLRIWLPISRPGLNGSAKEFLPKLQEGWFSYLESLFGEPIQTIKPTGHAMLEQLTNSKKPPL